MKLKEIVKLTIKAKNLTSKGISFVSKLSANQIMLGTIVTLVPGGMVVTGAYVAGNKLIRKYKDYKIANETPKGFISWAGNKTGEEIVYQASNVKRLTVKTLLLSSKGITKTTTNIKRQTINKVCKVLSKKK